MRFYGRIRFGDVEDELDASVEVDETHVHFFSGDEPLGSWCLADVVAERLVANEFEIDLAGEKVVFLADDQVNFAYGAVQKMAEGWARFHAMNPVRRRRALAAARREARPSRLDEVRRALQEARDELASRTLELPAGQQEESAGGPTTAEMPRSGFWAKVERATALDRQADVAVEQAVEVPDDPPRHRASHGAAHAADESAPEEEAPVPWIQPKVEEVPVPHLPPPLPPPPRPQPLPTQEPEPQRADRSEAGLRAAIRALFGKGTKTAHEHSFVESTTTVGIVRRVCLDCGYVSIGVAEQREA
nr:hypothetical protein [Acidimicrobiia bacterium]